MLNGKTPKESTIIMTEIVLPNDTNALGNLRGGKILHWMDIASAIAAGKHWYRINKQTNAIIFRFAKLTAVGTTVYLHNYIGVNS